MDASKVSIGRGKLALVGLVLAFSAAACGHDIDSETQQPTGQESTSDRQTPIDPRATITRVPNTPSPPPSMQACVTATSLRVRSGPGTGFGVIRGVSSGECYLANGRNSDASWLQISIPGAGLGWVSAEYLEVDGNPIQLPIRRPTPTATPPRPTATITRQPTATTLITPYNGGGNNCHPSYPSHCLAIGIDYDCAGGEGDGPRFVRGPVTVVGNDPYRLDRDGDGIGCE